MQGGCQRCIDTVAAAAEAGVDAVMQSEWSWKSLILVLTRMLKPRLIRYTSRGGGGGSG